MPSQRSERLGATYSALKRDANPREASLDFRALCLAPEGVRGLEKSILMAAENALLTLRGKDNIYATYARADIIEGLGGIDHPDIQASMAKWGLHDKNDYVVRAAKKALTRPDRYIHPTTFDQLLTHENQEDQQVAMEILEQNPETSLTAEGGVVKSVGHFLHSKIAAAMPDNEGALRAAIVTSHLYERSHGNINNLWRVDAGSVLERSLEQKIKAASSDPDTFAALVNTIAATNLPAAKVSEKISEMELDLPERLPADPEEIAALIRLRKNETEHGATVIEKYNSLVVLATERARAMLPEQVAQAVARKKEWDAARQVKIDEAQQRLQAEQMEKDTLKERKKGQREAQELFLSMAAEDYFPHLKIPQQK